MSAKILDMFHEIVQGRDAVVIECGCNDGYHTKLMHAIGVKQAKSYRHIAIEPDPRMEPYAKKVVRLGRVDFIKAAACERSGRIKLWLSSGKTPKIHYTGSSSINRPTGVTDIWKDMQFTSTADVAAVTLDEIFRSCGLDHVDLIWADVQGAEKRMIAGGLGVCLPNTRYLYTEYSNGGLYEDDATLGDIIALLPGWSVAHNFGGDALLENPGRPAAREVAI